MQNLNDNQIEETHFSSNWIKKGEMNKKVKDNVFRVLFSDFSLVKN